MGCLTFLGEGGKSLGLCFYGMFLWIRKVVFVMGSPI